MSFLRKLFSSRADSKTQVWRAVRVQVGSLHRILFHPETSPEPPLEVGNISSTGLGLLPKPENQPLISGPIIRGNLEINLDAFPVQMEIRHRTGRLIGCRFLGDYHRLSQAIESYLAGEILALQLKPIDTSILTPDPAGQVHWFTDSRQNELFFVMSPKGLEKFHLSFLGHYLEYGANKNLQYGHIIDDKKTDKPNAKQSALINIASELPAEVLPLAKRILLNIPQLPEPHRLVLLQLLKKEN